jgi:uncharacterized YceG family protein
VFGKSRSHQPRSDEDRARAAAERAARRGGRLPAAAPGPDEEPEEDLGSAPTNRGAVTALRQRPAPMPPRGRGGPRGAGGGALRQPRHGGPGRRPRWGRRLIALAAIAALGVALYMIDATFQPFHGAPHGAVRVTVPPGASAGQIGDILERHGVVDSGTFFEIDATVTGRRGRLRPGTYTLPLGMSYGDAIEALMQGPKAKVVKTFTVTIPEGPSRREVAPLIARSGIRGNYLKASGAPWVLRRVRRLGAPRGVRTAEGFLFPSTYRLLAGATARDLVARQLAAFAQRMRHVDLRAARRRKLTRYDVLIIASMVEREAKLPRERPLIAAVIYNRLRRGMPLGIDATIRYYTSNWQRPIRVSELKANEPYNTRLRPGLPPTPIGNPGLAAIQAAAHPAHRDYLFFVRKPGRSGEHAFSSTDAQFQRDEQRYQASRGGP